MLPFVSGKLPRSKRYGFFDLVKGLRWVPEVRFGRMIVFCSPCECINYLFHNNYRLMKKAEISFVDYYIHNVELSERTFMFGCHAHRYSAVDVAEFAESRIFCNGREGIIIPTKYL